MSLLGAVFIVIGFAAIAYLLRLPKYAGEVFTKVNSAMLALRDPDLGDDQKEKLLQQYAIRMFALLGILTGGSVLALTVPLGLVWTLGLVQIMSFDGVLETLVQWEFIVGTCVIGLVAYRYIRPRTREL